MLQTGPRPRRRWRFNADSNRARFLPAGAATWTLGHWRGKPLLLQLPVLPSHMGHNGVLNYFVVFQEAAPDGRLPVGRICATVPVGIRSFILRTEIR